MLKTEWIETMPGHTLLSSTVIYQAEQNGSAAAQQGSSLFSWLEVFSSILLVAVTIGYVYLTYKLAKQNKEQVKEVRRERNRPIVLKILLHGIEPLKLQLENHESGVKQLLNPESGYPNFQSIEFRLELPPEHFWTHLVSEHPDISELHSNIETSRQEYEQNRIELIENLGEILIVISDAISHSIVEPSEEYLRSWAQDIAGRRNENLTAQNLNRQFKNLRSTFNENPSKEEFSEILSKNTNVNKKRALSLYEWLANKDYGEDEDISHQSWDKIPSSHSDDRDSTARNLAEQIIEQRRLGEAGYEFHWIALPDESNQLQTNLEDYCRAVLQFKQTLEKIEQDYKEEYAIWEPELEMKREDLNETNGEN